jgi:hypothetical protein
MPFIGVLISCDTCAKKKNHFWLDIAALVCSAKSLTASNNSEHSLKAKADYGISFKAKLMSVLLKEPLMRQLNQA